MHIKSTTNQQKQSEKQNTTQLKNLESQKSIPIKKIPYQKNRMYIKAYNSRRVSHNPPFPMEQVSLHSRKASAMDQTRIDDQSKDREKILNDSCFHRPQITPHLEKHRSVGKRRMIKMKENMRSSPQVAKFLSRDKTQALRNNYLDINNSRINDHLTLSNKHSTILKQCLIRQMFQSPDYTNNNIKPCKIESMTINQRPQSGRKPSSHRQIQVRKQARKDYRNSDRYSFKFRKSKDSAVMQSLLEMTSPDSSHQCCHIKIQPWGEIGEQDFFMS